MADDTDTQVAQAQAPPPPDLSNLSQTDLANALRTLQAVPPPVTVDQTPVDRSWTSKIGEFLGGGGGPGAAALSPAQKEAAGSQALRDFGIHLMLASHYVPGQTLFSNLGQGLLGAEQSYQGQEQQAAGVLASKQGYQQEQQQMNIQRIKAALPLLSLQAQQAAGQRALGIGLGNQNGPPSTNIGTGGSIGQVNVPPEYLPFYQAASARTGIPVETLIAQSRQESGFNPNATGKAGEIGIAQVMPATAKSPGFGMAGVDPKALRDPETAINFQADYLKAHLPKGADPTDPVAIAKALQGYNGGGDPNYVANVNRYLPGARAALAPPPRPGNQPAPTPGTVAPPVVGARPVLPPPQPAIAPNAGAQVAGPAAPTSGVIPPSPPPVQVAGPGAGPPAPGQGQATVAPTTPPVTAQPPVQTPPPNPTPDIKVGDRIVPYPGTAQEYYAAHGSPGLSPQALHAYDDEMRAASQNITTAPVEIPKIMAVKNAAIQAHDAADRTTVMEQYKTDKEAYNAAASADQASRNKIAEINATSDAQASGKALEAINTATAGSQDVVNQAQMGLQLSRAAGTPGFLSKFPQVADDLIRAGLLAPGQIQQIGAQRALESVTNKLIMAMKQQGGISRFTNQDLTFLQNTAPSSFSPEQLREPMFAAIISAGQRQAQYGHMVNSLHAGGMPVWEAQQTADQKLGSIIPNTPTLDNITDPNARLAAQGQWVTQNVPVGSFYMKPNGKLGIRGPTQVQGQ